MSLYVRHCAWLNAVPESDDKGNDATRKKPAAGKKARTTRREGLKKDLKLADDEELSMPPCEAVHLLCYLFEIGPTQAAGMGEAPISHIEIEAWQSNTGIVLDAWQARTLKKLSSEYLAESNRATEPECPAPWLDAPYVRPVSNLVAQRMQQSLKELTKL